MALPLCLVQTGLQQLLVALSLAQRCCQPVTLRLCCCQMCLQQLLPLVQAAIGRCCCRCCRTSVAIAWSAYMRPCCCGLGGRQGGCRSTQVTISLDCIARATLLASRAIEDALL